MSGGTLTMDYQLLFNIVGGFASVALGWFASQLWSAVQELKSDLSALRADLPAKYVAKSDYRDDIRDIRDLLQKISDQVAGKVDR